MMAPLAGGSARPKARRSHARRSSSSPSAASTSQQRQPTGPSRRTASLTLESIIGLTAANNAGLAVNEATGEVAYPAGCVVVIYSPSKHRQVRFFRASRTVACVAWSTDGRFLAVGERGHQPGVIVWDLSDGRVVAELRGHTFGVSCLAFSTVKATSASVPPLLVSVGFRHDRRLIVWDVGNGSRTAEAKLAQKVHAIDFSPDGKFFVTCGERHVTFWRMGMDGKPATAGLGTTGVPVIKGIGASVVESHRQATFVDVRCGHGSLRRSTYAVTSNGALCVFSRTFAMEQWMALETAAAFSLTFVGDYVAAGGPDGLVRLFDAETLRYAATLPRPPPLGPADQPLPFHRYGATLCLRSITQSGSSNKRCQVAAIYGDRSLVVWDADTGGLVSAKMLRCTMAHSSCIWDMQFVPWCRNANVRPRPPPQSAEAEDCKVVVDVEEEEPGDGRLPNGVLATCSADNTVRLWCLGAELQQQARAGLLLKGRKKPQTRELLATLHIDDAPLSACKMDLQSIKHSVAAARAVLAEQASDAEMPSKPESTQSPRCVTFHPRATELACGDREGNLRVYDLADMRLKTIKPAHDAEILSADYSPVMRRKRVEVGGGQAAAVANVTLPTWEAADADTPEREGDLVLLATGSRDRLVHVSEATKGYTLVQTLENHSSSITAVRFSRDGRGLMSCGGDKALVMSAVNGRHLARVKSISVPHGSIYDIDTDPTNKYMVSTGQDKRVNIWQMRTGKHARSYKASGTNGELYRVAVDPSGLFVAACSFDKWVRVFDFYSGECLARVAGHSELVTGVRFSPDGKRLVSVGGDGCIFVWRLPSEMTTAMTERLEELRGKGAKHPLPSPAMIRLGASPGRVKGVHEGDGDGDSEGSAFADGGRETGTEHPQEKAKAQAQKKEAWKLMLRTADLPAWALEDHSSEGVPHSADRNTSIPPQDTVWAKRVLQAEPGGQAINAQVRDKKGLTVEEIIEGTNHATEAEAGAVSQVAEDSDNVLMGPAGDEDDEGHNSVDAHDLDDADGERRSSDAEFAEHDEEDSLSVEAIVPDVDTSKTDGEDGQGGGALSDEGYVVEYPVDDVSSKLGSFTVRLTKDGESPLVEVTEMQDEAMRLEDELLADAKGVVDKEGWLRKELKDLAPTDSQGVEAVNFDQRARESFSGTFFLSQHEKRLAQQEQQEDVTRHAVDDQQPMLPPPPPRQTPHVQPVIMPPPPPPSKPRQVGETYLARLERQAREAVDADIPSSAAEEDGPPRGLASEGKVVKARDKKKRATAEAVQHMRDRLRAMGLLRDQERASAHDDGVMSAIAELRAEAKKDVRPHSVKATPDDGLTDRDFMDQPCMYDAQCPPQDESKDEVESLSPPVGQHTDLRASQGELSGMLQNLFGRKKGHPPDDQGDRDDKPHVDEESDGPQPEPEVTERKEDEGAQQSALSVLRRTQDAATDGRVEAQNAVSEALSASQLETVRETSMQLPRPVEAYRDAIRQLNVATHSALKLYAELLQVQRTMSPSHTELPTRTSTTAVGPVDDLLDSFKRSFADLSSAAQSVIGEHEGVAVRHAAASDSAAGGSGVAGSGLGVGEVPLQMLEKYSDLLLGMLERKVDTMLATRASTSQSSKHGRSAS